MVNNMSFSNRKILTKNSNSQINKLKYDYFKSNKTIETEIEKEDFKTERYK